MGIRAVNNIIIILISTTCFLYSYTNISPAGVYNKLVAGDSLLVLDVRETWEYTAGHMAEPESQLPLTPVNMPWSSGVLSSEHHRLPNDIDILVYCRSGGRSAAASAFLEANGFTRIYNMTGGFSSWAYESRTGGFGDHSGRWVRLSDPYPVIVTSSATEGDTSKIIFSNNVLTLRDSMYIELHFASNKEHIPPDVPKSDIDGLFRVTALDRFGLSLFVRDSLVLFDTTHVKLSPNYQGSDLYNLNMTVYVPGEGWRNVSNNFDSFFYSTKDIILRKWYNVSSNINTGIISQTSPKEFILYQNFPNPFNPVTTISYRVGKLLETRCIASLTVNLSIFNIRGQLIATLVSENQPAGVYTIQWDGSGFTSGIYFYKLTIDKFFIQTKKLILLE
jgi:rhodanese-related sulfurtransferase